MITILLAVLCVLLIIVEFTEMKKEPFWKSDEITKVGYYILKTENEYVLAEFDGKGLDIDSEMTGQHILGWHKIEEYDK